MEIPVFNRIGDFEAGIYSLHNPSFVSQIFELSKIHRVYSFCKWGALILALVVSFSTIINRIKILIIRIQNRYFIPSSPQLNQALHHASDTDTSCSSLSDDQFIDDDDEAEAQEEEEEDKPTTSQIWRSIDEDFSVKGSGYYTDKHGQNRNLSRRANSSMEDLFSSFSEFTNRKNVVRLWDNLGLGLRFNIQNDTRNSASVYDIHKDQNILSVFGEKSEIPAVSTSFSSPAVIVSAETNFSSHLLRVWDTRVGCRLPGILAEWTPKLGKIVGIDGGGEGGLGKVYVRDDVTGKLTVGDMRNVRSPLVASTGSDVETWWDADAVIVGEGESVGEASASDSLPGRG